VTLPETLWVFRSRVRCIRCVSFRGGLAAAVASEADESVGVLVASRAADRVHDAQSASERRPTAAARDARAAASDGSSGAANGDRGEPSCYRGVPSDSSSRSFSSHAIAAF
jgi:hypothetical protein